MANTGRKIVTRLKEVIQSTGAATGNTKPNNLGDPDYIAPYESAEACPIVYATTCPVVAATGGMLLVHYEFSLADAVLKNPAIKKVRVKVSAGPDIISSQDYVLPQPNYFAGDLYCDAGIYWVGVDYLDLNDVVVASCDNLKGVTVEGEPPPDGGGGLPQ